MKKKIIFLCVFFQFVFWQNLFAESISFVVPKQSLIDKSSLLLVMRDGLGHQCVGMYQLDEGITDKKILQQDLYIQDEKTVELSDSIDITNNSSQICDNEVLLHFELDKDMKILRILLIKDNIFAENPFNVCLISLDQTKENQEEIDEFADLMENIDEIDQDIVQKNSLASNMTFLAKYKLYLQLYLLMKYQHIKRKINDLVVWFQN